MAGAERILSIDGGGIRGVIPAMVLNHIEECTGKPIAELFEVIAGTSTGGILALGLTVPGGEGGGPRYTAAQLLELYEKEGERIFPQDFFTKIRQLSDEKYPAQGLEEVLGEKFGETRLREALTGVMVTAYDIERRSPIFFRSLRAEEDPEGYDFPMAKVARATSAAPTYFEPLRLDAGPLFADYTLVDGGVFANNPGMCVFVDSYAGEADDDTLMVSLGTGELTRPLPYEKAKDWGLLSWAPNVLDVVFDGVSDTVNYQLSRIVGESYYRFQTELRRANDELDDASERNLDYLKLEGEQLINDNAKKLDQLCERLIAP